MRDGQRLVEQIAIIHGFPDQSPLLSRLRRKRFTEKRQRTRNISVPVDAIDGLGTSVEQAYVVRSGEVHEGFFEEDGVIWAADGTMLAQSRQLAILMPLEKR